jgi:hypothetical protein
MPQVLRRTQQGLLAENARPVQEQCAFG